MDFGGSFEEKEVPVKPRFKDKKVLVLSEIERKKIKKRKIFYKMIEGQWYKFVYKMDKDLKALKKIKDLRKKIRQLEKEIKCQ